MDSGHLQPNSPLGAAETVPALVEGHDTSATLPVAAEVYTATDGMATAGASHLDEIARSLKVPAVPPASLPPPSALGTGPVPGAPRTGPTGLKRDRQKARVEEEATAAELLLGIATVSDSGGSDDTQSAGRNAPVSNAPGNNADSVSAPLEENSIAVGGQTQAGRQSRTGDTTAGGIRRSARGRSSMPNPALAAEKANDAAEYEFDNDDMAPRGVPQARRPAGPGRGRPPAQPQAQLQTQVQLPTATLPAAMPAVDLGLDASAVGLTTLPMGTPLLDPRPTPVTATSTGQKSELTLLCERFVHQFGHLQPDGSPTTLMLNDVAEALGVARRRLYDVINVFESIEVMRRVGKLMYEFCGYDHLPGLLSQLASDEDAGVPVEDRIRRAPTAAQGGGDAGHGDEQGSEKNTANSLWVLSRRLVRMLLKSQGPIALTAAAAVLVGPGGVTDPSEHRSQTQITVERRLYDIGSILCSQGLVERVYIKKRQPAFEWIYGWRPGDTHPPPELAVALMSRQPAPPLTIMPRRPEETAARQGRRGGRSGGGGSKRQKTSDPHAGMMMNALGSFGPMGAFSSMMGPLGGFPPSMLAAMSGGSDDKNNNFAAMAQLYGGLFSPMTMGMGLPPGMVPGSELGGSALGPAGAEGVKEEEGAAAGEGGVAVEGQDGAAAPSGVPMPTTANLSGPEAAMAGLMMWPPAMMMHPAVMMQQMQQQANAGGGATGAVIPPTMEGVMPLTEGGEGDLAASMPAFPPFALPFMGGLMPGIAPLQSALEGAPTLTNPMEGANGEAVATAEPGGVTAAVVGKDAPGDSNNNEATWEANAGGHS